MKPRDRQSPTPRLRGASNGAGTIGRHAASKSLAPMFGACAAAFLATMAVGQAGRLFAQDSPRTPVPPAIIAPRSFGLDIEPGPVSAGGGRRVTTSDESGRPVVGEVLVRVGDVDVVHLPDGSLAARTAENAAPTERPFQPATMEEIAEQLLAERLAGFRTKKTRHYLYVYDTSETFASIVSRILESMLPGATAFSESQGIATHAPRTPLVVVMFRTEDSFRAYQSLPDGISAYYHVLTNQVVMYEESRTAELKPELALQQMLATVAHEGTHQILNNIGVQQRLSVWPMWVGEGLAEYLAPTFTDKRLRWKGAGQVNDFRMFELERYLKRNSGDDASGKLVEQTVLAARLTSTGYASAWALTHFLAKSDREAFDRYVRELSRLGPMEASGPVVEPGVVPAQRTRFAAEFGDDFPAIEKRLVAHLKRLPYRDPFSDWPHFVAIVAVPDRRSVKREANVFHSQSAADKWRRDILARESDDARSASQSSIREFPNRAAAEAFASQWLQTRP